ncbi:MAG: glycoside hydrolase family 57 protein [Bacillota bacterium]|nr:glycoside hydrolase family 57 protein [Bacillota bacterium]
MTSNIMLVLHSHIPYVKRQGRWPFGEVWLFEAMAETYIPFLRSWYTLKEEKIDAPITLSFSPTLLEQLNSKYIQQEFITYLKEREEAALKDERYFVSQSELEMAAVAASYNRFYKDVRRDFVGEFDCNIIQAVKDLQDEGRIEVITTAASHAYLPLLDQSSLEHQIVGGKKAYEKYFEREPRGFWLPECGYFQGIEDMLQEQGIHYFFVDSHGVEGGKPLGDSSPGVECEGFELESFKNTGLSTYRPYRIKNKDIMVLGRNAMVSHQVWSADSGYPGDGYYREFHKEFPGSGLKYWRVTDRYNSLDKKLIYSPEQADRKAYQHAVHFVNSLETTGKEATRMGYPNPLIVGCYDTELFGHWWWEGVRWLEEMVRVITDHKDLQFILPSQISSDLEEAEVFESSWGMGGKHYVWDNQETNWMWEVIRGANQEFNAINHNEIHNEIGEKAYSQALRELILIESSDWLFMVSNNHTRDYAMKRFFEHYAKFLKLTNVIHEATYSKGFIEWLDRVQMEDDFLYE